MARKNFSIMIVRRSGDEQKVEFRWVSPMKVNKYVSNAQGWRMVNQRKEPELYKKGERWLAKKSNKKK